VIIKGAVAHETTVHTYLLLMTLVQTEINTAEALMPEPSAFEVEMAIEKQKGTNHEVFSNLSTLD